MSDSSNVSIKEAPKTSENLLFNSSSKDCTVQVDSPTHGQAYTEEISQLTEKEEHAKSSVNSNCTVQDENKLFYCNICNMGFKTDVGLNVHLYNNCRMNLAETDQNDSAELVLPGKSHESIKSLKKDRPRSFQQKRELPIYMKKQTITHTHKTGFKEGINIREQHQTVVVDSCATDQANSSKGVVAYKSLVGTKPLKLEHLHKSSNKQKIKKIALNIPEKETYFCYICKLNFDQKVDLKRHFRIHPEKKPFRCDICQKGFIFMYEYTRHYRKHKKPFMCDSCPRRYKEKAQLDKHYLTHSKEKSYVCELCKKAYCNKYALVAHVKTHTDEKQYVGKF